MLSLANYSNADATVIKFLKYLSVSVQPETIIAELDKHPDYPSLLAVSDVLTASNIENNGYRLTFQELRDIPAPFIAHINSNGGELAVVTKIKHGRYYLSNEKWDNHKVTAEEFEKLYTGVTLTGGERTASPAAIGFASALSNFKTPAIAAASVLILVAAISHSSYFAHLSWQLLALTLFKSAGLIVSILLLVQSIDSNNPLVQVLCQTKGKTDCNAILSSKAAKITGWLSWSEVGFFYFAGTWLLLLFGGGSPAIWQALAVLNIISLPYTVYSIYYQARVAKQWCVLCCAVQGLLWLEFISLSYYLHDNAISFGAGWNEAAWSTVFIALLSPLILWALLKPLFLKLQQLKPLKEQLRKFKYNTELFNMLVSGQPRYAIPDEEWCIVLGNAKAANIFTMVTNPYCPPCAKTHQLLDELLKHRDDIQARIVFTANNDERDHKTPISRHLMALNELNDKTIVRKALHDWYEQKQKNYEAWAKIYPIQLKESEFYKIDRQHDWCQMAEVTATPTMLLNGYRLPELYQLTDLKYMLE